MTALCLTMIVRNEGTRIDRCLDAVAPFVAYYVVCDTGSTDDTSARILATMDRYGIPGEIHDVGPKEGAQARNEALDRARASVARFDYLLLIKLSGGLWAGAFLLFLLTYGPKLLGSRPDGKP